MSFERIDNPALSPQTFVVPAGVTTLDIEMLGRGANGMPRTPAQAEGGVAGFEEGTPGISLEGASFNAAIDHYQWAGDWSFSDESPYLGNFCASATNENSTSPRELSLTIRIYGVGGGSVSFWVYTDGQSEDGSGGRIEFLIDGEAPIESPNWWSQYPGVGPHYLGDWTLAGPFFLSGAEPGQAPDGVEHTLSWRVHRDGDANPVFASIDDVAITPLVIDSAVGGSGGGGGGYAQLVGVPVAGGDELTIDLNQSRMTFTRRLGQAILPDGPGSAALVFESESPPSGSEAHTDYGPHVTVLHRGGAGQDVATGPSGGAGGGPASVAGAGAVEGGAPSDIDAVQPGEGGGGQSTWNGHTGLGKAGWAVVSWEAPGGGENPSLVPEGTFVHDGFSIDYTPMADVAAGDVVVQGELVGVARHEIAAGRLGTLTLAGVFNFAKSMGVAYPAGTLLYWDDAAQTVTATANGHKRLGKTVRAADAADTTVPVRMTSSP